MKRTILFSFLFSMLIFSGVNHAWQTKSIGVVKGDNLRVRSEPGGPVMDRLNQGMVVTILGTKESALEGKKTLWYQLEYMKNGALKTGYASADWINTTPPASLPTPIDVGPPPTLHVLGVTPESPKDPIAWLKTIHTKDPSSQDWITLKNLWIKRYAEETLKYITEAAHATPNLDPQVIEAYLDQFVQEANTEMVWARDHATDGRIKSTDLKIAVTERGEYLTRSIMADDLANLLQIYVGSVNAAKTTSRSIRK